MLASVQAPHSLEQGRAWQAWRLACGSAQLARMAGSGEQAVHANVRCTLICVVQGRQSAPNGAPDTHAAAQRARAGNSVHTCRQLHIILNLFLKCMIEWAKHLAWRAAA